MDPWINQQKEVSPKLSKFENDLLSIRDERQEMIYPNCHPTYNERHQKIIELIDWTLERYRTNIDKTQNEKIVIDNIMEELDKKRKIEIHKMKQSQLNDDVLMYRLQETTIDNVLFKIRELTGRLV